MKQTISFRLIRRLEAGKKRLSPEAQHLMRDFIVSQSLADSSFKNRRGESDLYYTAFGWLLSYLWKLPLNKQQQATYLAQRQSDHLDLVHYVAYRRCQLLQRLSHFGQIPLFFEMHRRQPMPSLASFASLPLDDPWSPYTRFLWLSLQEDCAQPLPDSQVELASLAHYQTAEGGYANVAGWATASTNATTAALTVIGQLTHSLPNVALTYLRNSQQPTGGFSATAVSPMPDLLSTATALFTLKNYGVTPCYPASDFVEAHWLPNGGFAPTLLEEESDVEYLFYGLLALGSL